MDFDTPGAFALFLSLGAVGVGVLRLWAYRMKLTAETEQKRLEAHSSNTIDDLRDEVQHALARQSAEIDELHQRLDFAERLLTRPVTPEATSPKPREGERS
jgi:hypothetical protein